MRNELKKDLEERIATELHKLSDIAFLKEISIDSYFDEAVSILYLYTRVSKVYKRGNKKLVCFTEVCATIGRKIMALNGLKRDSLKATRAGAFFIYTFDKFGILEIHMERLKQDKFTYRIRVLKKTKCELFGNELLELLRKNFQATVLMLLGFQQLMKKQVLS